jgi:hypothetical protein
MRPSSSGSGYVTVSEIITSREVTISLLKAKAPPGLTLRVWPGLLTMVAFLIIRHILAKSHAVPAAFARNDVKKTAQWREGGATI